MDSAKRIHRWLALVATLAAGCGIGMGGESAPAVPGEARVAPPPADPGQALPSRLTCVSAAAQAADQAVPEVWRVRVTIADGATLTLSRGPEFAQHAGRPAAMASPEVTQAARVTAGRTVRFDHTGSSGVSLVLERRGLFFVGSLIEDQCYLFRSEPVVCWNDAQVRGSPWSGTRGAFPARFDHATGRCQGADGGEAWNAVPIEYVRESRFGECADLRGVALNDRDFGDPELSGWQLAGAVLDGARLHFARLTSATLRGAQLAGLEMGYATVQGATDGFTVAPRNAECRRSDSPWAGSSMTCVR